MSEKRFHLRRIEDATGVSGTGRVAEGVVFSDGTCAIRWLTATKSTAVYATLADVITIHGHDGGTLVVFDDCPLCDHEWKHHWMDGCDACDLPGCPCSAMAGLPRGAVAAPTGERVSCICSPSKDEIVAAALDEVAARAAKER